MQKKTLSFLALTFLVQVFISSANCQARAQAEKASYRGNGSSRSVLDARREF